MRAIIVFVLLQSCGSTIIIDFFVGDAEPSAAEEILYSVRWRQVAE